jgi:iron complex outermembrane receptor protein
MNFLTALHFSIRISILAKIIGKTLFLLILSVNTLVKAEDNNSIEQFLSMSIDELLDYEVTSPTKSLTKLSDSPGSISVITYEKIRKSSARTIPELLRTIPGVHVRWNPMVQTIEIRSFGSNPFTSKILLMIDGIPYNSWNKGGFPQHPGFDFFNLKNVKHIEIIRGSGSSLYGENALNGVINIVTLSGDEYRQTRASIYVGNNNARAESISHGTKISEDASIFLSARNEEGQLPTELWNDSVAKGKDLYLKGQYKGFQLSYYRRQDSFEGFQDLVVPPNFSFKSVENIAQKINIASAKYNDKAADQSWSIEANASYADRKGTHCGGCHAASQSTDFSKQLDHGYQAFANVQVSLHQLENHEILIGAEKRNISSGESLGQIPSPHDETKVSGYSKGAIFVQDQISIIDDQLTTIVGLRYDTATSPSLFGSNLFPRVAILAKPTKKLTIRAGFNKASRYPSFTELYQNIRFFSAESPDGNFAFPSSSFKPNPELKPERIQSSELGFEYRIRKEVQAKLDFYYNKINSPIIVAYGRGTIGFENHGNQAIIKGFELEFLMDPNKNLSTFINWSYQDSQQKGNNLDSSGLPIEFTYAPKNKINAGMTYELSEQLEANLEVSWRDQYVGPEFWNNIVFGDDSIRQLSAYTYANLHFRYRLPYDFGISQQPITFSFYVKNITNEKPQETLIGAGRNNFGREYFIGFDYEWTN